jgi:regulator of replication initiation timing
MLAKEHRSLRKTVEEKADRKDILKRLTEMRRENTELRDENVMLRDKIAKMTSPVAKEAKTEVRSYVDSVVKNLPASSAGSVTYKEVEDDRKSVIRVFALTGAVDLVEEPDIAESILSIRRLGKYDKERHFRPILLKLSRSDLREKLVRTGRRMKELNEANQTRYRIEADLTKEQSENYQEMWKKADTQSGNGVKYYVTSPRENPSLRSREMTEEVKEAVESKKDKEED